MAFLERGRSLHLSRSWPVLALGRDVHEEIVALLYTMTIFQPHEMVLYESRPRLGLFSGRAAPPHPVTLFYSEFTGHGFEIEWFVLAPAVARRPSRLLAHHPSRTRVCRRHDRTCVHVQHAHAHAHVVHVL